MREMFKELREAYTRADQKKTDAPLIFLSGAFALILYVSSI